MPALAMSMLPDEVVTEMLPLPVELFSPEPAMEVLPAAETVMVFLPLIPPSATLTPAAVLVTEMVPVPPVG
jgi:hypothetical protein